MADIESNIDININAAGALNTLKVLQAQISAFHQSMAKGGAASAAAASQLQQNLVNSINATGAFNAQIKGIQTTTEHFTTSLEKNKLTMSEYFRYAGASTKTFGNLFQSEMSTIDKVARERVKDLQTQYIKLGRDANGAMKAIAVRPLALDMNDLGTKTAIAAQKQQLFNQLVQQGSTNLLNFGKNTQWAGRQLMVGFTVPLTMFGAIAAKSFMQIEEQAVRFKRVYGDAMTPSSETDAMTQQVQDLASSFTQYGVSISNTMKMAADAAAMGKQGADLLAQVNETSKLAVLGGIDQQKALETVTSLTNTFGIATKDLAGNINFLNAVENQTVLSIEDLSTAIPIAAPVVQQLGGNVKDLSFFLTAMKEGGINASEGANALKSGLASLINPSKQATDLLASFGINIDNIVKGNAGNVKGMITDLATSLEKLDPLNRAQAIEQLFGKFQFSRMSTLLQNVNKEGSQAATVLGLTKASAEELAIISERELKRISDSPAYKFKKSIEDLKASIAPVGEAFLKAVTPIIQFATDVLKNFDKMGDGAKNFVVMIVAAVAGLGPLLLMTVGLLANGFANIVKLFAFLGRIFSGTSNQSKILGEQTSYMTQEQLHAAAVAASLDQVHGKLRQTFTSEAEAVARLTQEYLAAIAAQRGFTGGVAGGRRTAPKKMADGGVVLVPGKGNSDTVPAMLTPGEAVIPKDKVKKYSGLIGGMIAGTIPGYSNGMMSVPGYSEGSMFVHRSHLTTPFAQDSAQFTQGLSLAGLTQLKQQYLQYVRVVSNLVAELPVTLNMQLQKGTATIESFSKGWMSRSGKLTSSAKSGGADVNDPKISAALAKLEKEIHDKTIALAKSTKDQKISDPLLEKATREVIDKYKSTAGAAGKAATALDVASQQIGQVRLSMPKAAVMTGLANQDFIQDKLGRVYTGDTQIARISQSEKNAGMVRPADSTNPSGSYAKKPLLSQLVAQTEAVGEQLVVAASQGLVSGAKKGLQVASPSKVMDQVGQDSGQGLANGARKKKAAAAAAGEELGAAVTAGAASQSGRAAQYRDPTTGRFAKAPDIVPGGTSPEEPGAKKSMMRKVSGGAMAATGVVMAASMVPGQVGETAQKLMMPMMAISAITSMFQMMNPIVAGVLIGFVALTAGILSVKGSFDAAKDKALELGDALGTGTSAMKKFSEFAGTVSATELMDARRKNSMAQYEIQTGKSSFGDNYVKSDAGKAMLASLTEAAKGGDIATITQMVSSQMATAVASGALNTAQARSIVASLATQLGDYNFGINVNGNLMSLLGPNGENLLKDPLQVRMQLIQDTQSKIIAGKDTGNIQNNIQYGAGMASVAGGTALGVQGAVGAYSAMAASAAAAATEAAAATAAVEGTAIALETTGGILDATIFGAPLGVILNIAGAIVAIGGGLLAMKTSLDNVGKSAGTQVALGLMALEQQQQMIDSLDIEYQKRIAAAVAAGDVAKADALSKKQIEDKNALLAEGAKTTKLIVDQYGQADALMQGGMGQAVDKAIENKYKDNPLMQQVAISARDATVAASGLNQTQEYQMKLSLATGELDPQMALQLLNNFGENSKVMTGVLNIMTNLGSAEGNQALQIMNMFKNKQMQETFIAKIQAMPTKDAEKYLGLFTELQKTGSVVDLQTTLEYFVKNEKLADKTQEQFQALKDEAAKGPITLTVIERIFGAEVGAIVKANQDYFNSLPKDQQITYTTTIETIYATKGEKDAQAAYANWKAANQGRMGSNGKPLDTSFNTYANVQAASLTSANVQAQSLDSSSAADTSTSSGGGGGPQASALDDLIKKYRDLAQANTDLTLGWNASRTSIDELASSGMSGFNGLEQQMRKLGAGEDLISLIAGMPKDEYERRKNELFVFSDNGSIIGLRNGLANIAEMMRRVAESGFQNQTQKTIGTINNQQVAINKLVAAGMSLSQAYSAVQDAAFAAAIAQEKDSAVIAQTILNAEKAATALKNMAAAQAVSGSNQDFADQGKLMDFLTTNASKLTDAQIQAILQDKNLQTLALSPNFDPATFQQALDNVIAKTEIDLKVKKMTIEGLSSIFSDGFTKAMDKFSAQEKAIDLKFKIEKDPLQAIIKAAQQAISDLQSQPGGLNSLDADLTRISVKEKDINDAYDERISALDFITKINDKVSSQQKSQLSLADALSQGDIAAAARAAQEMRKQDAEQAISNQRDLLNAGKKAELEAVTGTLGLTRVQIEKQIADIKAQILEIEQQQIAPAQYALELIDRQAQSQKDALTVLGKTKDEWDAIQNGIDVARTNSDSYTKAISDARDVVSDILTYWNEIDGKKVSVNLGYTQTTTPNPTIAPAANTGMAAEATTGGGGGGGGVAAPQFENLIPGGNLPNVEGPKKPIEVQEGWPQNEGWWQSLMAMGSIAIDGWNILANWWNTEGPGKYINEWMQSFASWWDQYVTKPVKDFIDGIAKWWDEGPGAFFNTVFTTIGTWWDTYISKPIQMFFDWFFGKSSIEQKKKDIFEFFTSVGTFFGGIVTNIGNFIGQIPKFFQTAVNGAIGFLGQIGAWFGSLPGIIGSAISGLANNIGNGIRGILNGLFNMMRGVNIAGWKPFEGLPRLAKGGLIPGDGNKDNFPAMLMPGEFIVTKSAAQKIGINNLEMINRGQKPSFGVRGISSPSYNIGSGSSLGVAAKQAAPTNSNSVYNYSVNVVANTDASPTDIAQTVAQHMRDIDYQKVRGNRF